jgi:hypothetical protein
VVNMLDFIVGLIDFRAEILRSALAHLS